MGLFGKQTWIFHNRLYVNGSGTAVGPKEAEGPLGDKFDVRHDDLYCGEENWELAERRLMVQAIDYCLKKANTDAKEVDFFIAGDLLNQNVTSNYVARHLNIPTLCMFGACSTSMATIAISSLLVDSGFARKVLAATSSHFATAERQFRDPLQFGKQKPNTATTTVTGAGAVLIGKEYGDIAITSATIGRVVDFGIKNAFDMGSAMAPAAADTIKRHLYDLKRSPSDYDLIVTGDLSKIGSPILKQLLKEENILIDDQHDDCGLMIFHDDQQVFAGGSGCGCSAVVTYSHIFDLLKRGELKRVLVVATGALLSPIMMQQNESIPTIAHGVVFERTSRSVKS
ncbi:stage V sporulation protein AD [Bacillus alveayuensis]|uniref:Stage V sporulation protein AD n=1 Tax=Aeribacillus alveayuensis TaxID=279215 RepID=A0ABT9VKH3_9BACI|nr:stage V sporulation protein AD [Bacillus alveayuensis]MDQ0161470.1 stage V sporulation protein AD [Bacillus alveayuensis]